MYCPVSAQVKLAISYALAQSTKLSLHERRVAEMVLETKHLPESLARTGKVSLKSETIAKLIGKVNNLIVTLGSNYLSVQINTFYGVLLCTLLWQKQEASETFCIPFVHLATVDGMSATAVSLQPSSQA